MKSPLANRRRHSGAVGDEAMLLPRVVANPMGDHDGSTAIIGGGVLRAALVSRKIEKFTAFKTAGQ